jgi:hypothetical protein
VWGYWEHFGNLRNMMGMSLGIFGNTTRNMVVISKYINNLMEKR